MRSAVIAAALALCAAAGGCRLGDRPLELNSRLDGDLRGDLRGEFDADVRGEMRASLDGALRLEGPIVVQMQGPSVRYSGTFISETLYREVTAGRTSAAWVLAAFGEPDRRSAAPEGGEYWVWAYRLAAVEGSMVDIVQLGGDKNEDRTPTSVTVIMRIAGGVVAEKWRG